MVKPTTSMFKRATDHFIDKPEPEPKSYQRFSTSLMLVCIAIFLGVYGLVFSVLESGYFYLKAWYLPSAQSALRAAASILILMLVKYLITNPPNWASPFPPEQNK